MAPLFKSSQLDWIVWTWFGISGYVVRLFTEILRWEDKRDMSGLQVFEGLLHKEG